MAKKSKAKRTAKPKPAPAPEPVPVPKEPEFRTEATSGDGRLIARVEQTEDFRGMFHEERAWRIEVRDTTGTRILLTTRSWHGYTDDDRGGGTDVRGVAFEPNGNLLIGHWHGVETIPLPPPLPVPAAVALETCATALKAAYPERWEVLLDGVRTLLWPRAEICAVCSLGGSSGICDDCRALCDRRNRRSEGERLDPSMILAETVRALRAHSTDAADVIATLEAQAARVQGDVPCSICSKSLRDLADLRSPAGRLCAECVRKYAKGPAT